MDNATFEASPISTAAFLDWRRRLYPGGYPRPLSGKGCGDLAVWLAHSRAVLGDDIVGYLWMATLRADWSRRHRPSAPKLRNARDAR